MDKNGEFTTPSEVITCNHSNNLKNWVPWVKHYDSVRKPNNEHCLYYNCKVVGRVPLKALSDDCDSLCKTVDGNCAKVHHVHDAVSGRAAGHVHNCSKIVDSPSDRACNTP